MPSDNLLYSAIREGRLDDIKDVPRDMINSVGADEMFGPLTVATMLGNSEAIETLLSMGASPNLLNPDGSTALTYCRDPQCAQALIRSGAMVSAESPSDGMTALHLLAEEGLDEVLMILLDQADGVAAIDRFDLLDRTPLACAAQYGRLSTVSILLDRGANPDLRNWRRSGEGPLSRAIEFGQLEAAKLLLSQGATPHGSDIESAISSSCADQKSIRDLLRQFT